MFYIHHYTCPLCTQQWTQDTNESIHAGPHFQTCPDMSCGYTHVKPYAETQAKKMLDRFGKITLVLLLVLLTAGCSLTRSEELGCFEYYESQGWDAYEAEADCTK